MKKGFLNEGSKGGFQPPLLGGFQQPGLGDGHGGFYPDESGLWLPTQLSGLVDWHRSDMGVTLVGSKVSAWADQSSGGHNLTQSVDADRPDYVSNVINGKPVLRFGNAPEDNWMDWGGAAAPEAMTAFVVIKMVTAAQYQICLRMRPGDGVNFYLGGNGADFASNTPACYSAGPRAVWSAALTNGTNYLVKWHYDITGGANEDYATQVNAATEVFGSSVEAIATGTFLSLGVDPAVVGTQDFLSDIAEIIIYDRRLTTNEETMVRAYVTSRYGIVM